jgi:hypothetical protein
MSSGIADVMAIAFSLQLATVVFMFFFLLKSRCKAVSGLSWQALLCGCAVRHQVHPRDKRDKIMIFTHDPLREIIFFKIGSKRCGAEVFGLFRQKTYDHQAMSVRKSLFSIKFGNACETVTSSILNGSNF